MEENEDAVLVAHDNQDRAIDENNDAEFHDDDEEDEDSQSSELGADNSQPSDEAKSLSPEMYSALTGLASRLCAICQNLCRGEAKLVAYFSSGYFQKTGKLEYHSSLSSLRESVDAGCPLCKEVSRSFEECLDMEPGVRDTITDSWYSTCDQQPTAWCRSIDEQTGLRFNFRFYNSSGQGADHKLVNNIYMYFFPAEELGLGPEYSGYDAGATNVVSAPNIGIAKYWLNRCLDHCDHRDKAQSRILPTRLIEVRTHGGASANTMARLCEAEDLPKDASYLTLSHCWGGDAIFTLTKGNLGTLKQDIPVHQLPDLFKDALYMTSQLGIKYIWIDCLCILQDCRDDWAREAARMGDIYRYAKCNIAASGYENSKTSLFMERTPLPLLNFPLELDLVLVGDKETVGRDVRTPFKGIYVRATSFEFFDSITQGPLNSRGWVAQERALSPGILHFTPKQMWWECKNRIASESFPDIALPWSSAQKDNGPDALRTLSAETNIDDVYKSWNHFVQFYAETDLTVESDRFPALTGIAHAFRELTDDNLIAGFWERDLIQSLAWRVMGGDRAKKIPSEPLAPSWSWAFLCIRHIPAYFNRDTLTPLCICRRILSDDPDFRSDLQYTSINKSAVWGLAITGPLRKLPVRIKRLSKLSKWRDYVDDFNVDYDVADSSFFSAEDIATHSWHWEETRHILPLKKNYECHVTCLLLNQVQGAGIPNTFRRLGIADILFKDEDSCDKTLGIGKWNEKSKPSIFFEDCGQHDLILI